MEGMDFRFKTVFQQHHFEQDLYYNSAEIFAEKWKNITIIIIISNYATIQHQKYQ